MFKLKSEERTINVDIKMLNEENQALLHQIKELQEKIENLKMHLTIKEDYIIEQRFKINALETLVENWSKFYEAE